MLAEKLAVCKSVLQWQVLLEWLGMQMGALHVCEWIRALECLTGPHLLSRHEMLRAPGAFSAYWLVASVGATVHQPLITLGSASVAALLCPHEQAVLDRIWCCCALASTASTAGSLQCRLWLVAKRSACTSRVCRVLGCVQWGLLWARKYSRYM